MLLENCDPIFVTKINAIATQHSRTVEQVYGWWREYANACQSVDQSALLGEFLEWYGERLASIQEREDRREARVERYEERAEAARAEAEQRFNSPANQTLVGLQGQPILVGHHSEGRHRRLIDRAWSDMAKGCEAMKKAKHYDEKAAAAEHNGAISSDDPEALPKLRAKLAELETLQETMKTVNTTHARFTRDPEALSKSNLSDEYKQRIRDYVPAYSWEPHPFAPYQLSNNRANIVRVRERIESIERLLANQIAAPAPATAAKGDGWAIVEDPRDNRILFVFDSKPAEAVRDLLKSCGFRWSANRKAWVRMLNNAGRSHAQYVAGKLATILPE